MIWWHRVFHTVVVSHASGALNGKFVDFKRYMCVCGKQWKR